MKRNIEVENVVSGLGRKKGPWIICSSFLLFVTIILNLDFENERPFSPFNRLSHNSLKLPPYGPIGSGKAGGEADIPHQNWHNILLEESSNYTTTLTTLLHLNATSGSPCYRASTNWTRLEGLPEPLVGQYLFATDVLHRLTLIAYEENGERRCSGGDYFEVDFHNDHYRSRPPTVDFGNGSYGLDLIVPSRFAGSFVLEISLLYGNWHGLEISTVQWAKMKVLLTEQLKMVTDLGDPPIDQSVHNASLKQCAHGDFDRTSWQGRWTRTWFSEPCEADQEKRFRCLPEGDSRFQCEEPWCFGPVGRLDSNGWAYSAHCSFKIFQPDEAWKCLNGRWFLMWGDSNFQDTVRNLLLFVMDWPLPRGRGLSEYMFGRNYEEVFVNARAVDQTFQVSQVWNANVREEEMWEGLEILKHEEHQLRLQAYFHGTRWPDTIVMNSGMHDGIHHWTTQSYVESADWAVDWWIRFYTGLPLDRRPQLLWRTTIAPAGLVRPMPSNPNKLEMYNHIIMEKLQAVGDVLPIKFVDTFDLTFPFHYDNEYCDGGHYGRPPGSKETPWFGRPHWYFVDIMLAHIWLNALCPST